MDNQSSFLIPADVPSHAQTTYTNNYKKITYNTDRLFLFSCDQKIEHLNDDFYGKDIHMDALNPAHLFTIAQKGRIGAMAAHFGMIARYGKQFNDINYIVKLNGKTNIIPTSDRDPINATLACVDDVVTLQKNSDLSICGVGYTLYLGSEFEQEMMEQAADIIIQAHQHGLVAIIWIYPRGKAVTDPTSAKMAAGATGVAISLGADFVKIQPPENAKELRIATQAAGLTGVLCSGGTPSPIDIFLQRLHTQLHTGGSKGAAVGRSIFTNATQQAIAWTHALSTMIYDNESVATALQAYKKTTKEVV